MNLFVVGWNLPEGVAASALTALRRSITIYPQLDLSTFWQAPAHPTVLAACISTSLEAARPRRYVCEGPSDTGFYNGCLIDREGRFEAHDAIALLTHWDELAERLEGQFAIFRISKVEPMIEMITDHQGHEQIYTLQRGDSWLVSNSAGLIDQIADAGGLDYRAVSQFLTMGWAGGDRTLREEIRVVPAAQLWRWIPGRSEPEKTTHYPRSPLSRRRPDMLRPESLRRLADELVGCCRTLAESYGDLECALTGGQDSRVIAALLTHGAIRARYYTSGTPGSLDIQIAGRVAARLGVHHHVEPMTDAEVVAGWEVACHRLIQQNDGMVNLIQVADLVRQPTRVDRLKLVLWGSGAEVARGMYFHPGLAFRRFTWKAMRSFIATMLIDDHGGLVGAAACQETRALLDELIDEAADEGFSPLDFPNVFFVYDRQRRWGGVNARKTMPAGERFSPFYIRAFLEAAFGLSPAQRYCEPLHYRLMLLLAPDLERIPYDSGPRRSQLPIVNLLRWMVQESGRRTAGLFGNGPAALKPRVRGGIGTFDHAAWLEAKREWWRNLCLDQCDSPLWGLVDRGRFERLASPSTPESERRRRVRGIYNLITLFCYEAERGGVRSAAEKEPQPGLNLSVTHRR